MRALVGLSLLFAGCGASVTPDAGSPSRDAGARDAGVDAGPPVTCGLGSPEALAACVDPARVEADLRAVAVSRPPGGPHHQDVQDMCAERFEELGYEVERHDYGTGVNVVGVRAGSGDGRVLIGAHYDHLDGCVGADDNASGVAGVLEAARVLSTADHARTLVVACWDEEERGLIGSTAYAQREVDAGRTFDVVFTLEMIGFRDAAPNTQSLPEGFELLFPRAVRRIEQNDDRADFIALIGDEASEPHLDALARHAVRAGIRGEPLAVPAMLLTSPATADLRRSDHAPFWARGIPAVMITDTAELRYDAYHCAARPDVPENLDFAFASGVVAATVGAAAEALAR